MKVREVITVDGLAGSGKSTLAQLLAKRLGFVFFSTGLLYRSIAFLCREAKIDLRNQEAAVQVLTAHKFEIIADKNREAQVLVDGKSLTGDLRAPEVSEATSIISAHPNLRAGLIEVQRQALQGVGVVAEGRDMGTVIFPESKLKFFIIADEQVRATRRLAQFVKDKQEVTPDEQARLREQLIIEISERDKRDTERAVAPTKAAQGAVVIDNGSKPLTEVIEAMYHAARERGLI